MVASVESEVGWRTLQRHADAAALGAAGGGGERDDGVRPDVGGVQPTLGGVGAQWVVALW
jgi:hypothetical protein